MSVELLEAATSEFGGLLDRVVFLGGATVGLWITDPTSRASRVTYDVDVVEPRLAGFGRVWLASAADAAVDHELPSGRVIRRRMPSTLEGCIDELVAEVEPIDGPPFDGSSQCRLRGAEPTGSILRARGVPGSPSAHPESVGCRTQVSMIGPLARVHAGWSGRRDDVRDGSARARAGQRFTTSCHRARRYERP
jgi:hypothetical protein